MFRQLAAPFTLAPMILRAPGGSPAPAVTGQLLAAMDRAGKDRARADTPSRALQALVQANARLVRDARQSEQDAAEARRRQAAFLVTIAHELRNPLLPLRLAARSLEHAHHDAAQMDTLLATINSQVDHIGRLINDLLDSAAADAGRLRLQCMPVALGGVLDTAMAVCRPAMEARRHQFTSSCTSAPLPLEGDPVRLVQVFVNLLQNAAKYTPEGGRVSLRCERRGRIAVVTIADNGMGIGAAALPRLFKMFAQEEEGPGGLGIGLALVKQLVTAHGGSVSARSAGKGKGSEFVVTLPCSA
ncbi:MAG: HAMP domain-containing histidine kinase [Comamonadaceae bacterium]|nr:MAG: HAMP domain-containing histidine kinase [Comamonadaceae bacterium]